jgi:hypothetical protein
MGAPHGNANGMKHGLKSPPERFALGVLPRKLKRVEQNLLAFRRKLEAEVTTVHGTISIYLASIIHEVCAWERHAALCGRWLRDETTLTPDQREQSAARDPFSVLNRPMPAPIASEATSANEEPQP